MRRIAHTLLAATAASLMLNGFVASPVAADGTAPDVFLNSAIGDLALDLFAEDADGEVVELSCAKGVLLPGSVPGLPAASISIGLGGYFDIGVFTCTAVDDDGNSTTVEVGPFVSPLPLPPIIGVYFPEPRWFTGAPVVGDLVVLNPSPYGQNAEVESLSCTGAELGPLDNALPSGSVNAPLTVTMEGTTEVSCTATNTNGRQGTGTATVRIDAGSAGDMDPADRIADALQPAGTDAFAFVDTSTDPDTVGRLVSSNGLTGRVTDAPDQDDGVLVTVDPRTGPGSGPAEFEVCGSTVSVDEGSAVVLTCGSIIVTTVSGSAQVVLDNHDIVTVLAGSSAEVEDTTAGVTLTHVTGEGVSIGRSNSQGIPVPPGGGPFRVFADITPLEVFADTTPPTVTIEGRSATGGLPLPTYTLGAEPPLTCTAVDTESGLAGPCEATLEGGNANGVGTFTYKATASDRAGNQRTEQYSYRIIYRVDGFLPPINDPNLFPNAPRSVFKAGWIVPVVFQIKRADGSTVTPVETPKWISPIKGVSLAGVPNEPEPVATATTGDTFKRLGGIWYYNWRTKGFAGKSTYRIGVALDDGTVRSVVIGLR